MPTTPSAKSQKPDHLLNRFLSWAKRILFGAKKAEIAETPDPVESWYGTLYVAHRAYPRALYTWKFAPNYVTNPLNAIVFLYCDDIQHYPQRKWKPIKRSPGATHRLTLMTISPTGGHQELWTHDFDMVSPYGSSNCAWIVIHILAHRLLRDYYSQINWQELADQYVLQHRSRKRSRS